MELKPGYKHTEAGVIPNDWSVRAVGDICGYIVPGRNKPKHFDGEIPWVTTPDLEDGRGVSASRIGLCVTRAAARAIGSRVVPVGSVLMSCAGDLGITAITRQEIVINQQLHAFIPSSQIRAAFLLNVISSQKAQIAALATKTAVPYLNKSNCNSIKIPVPPVAEQEAIAEVLGDADALIESLEHLLAKKRQIRQGAMQELLAGKKRLPGFPGEWNSTPLGSLAEVVMGQSPSSAYYNSRGDGLPLIQGNADVCDRKTIRRVFTTQVTKRGRRGDTLMSVRAPVGEISRATFDVCLGRGVCAIRYPNDFLYHALIAKEPKWSKLSKGSTFDSVNSTDVKAFEVEIPVEESEQMAIAGVLSDMDAEIAVGEATLAKAHRMKHGIMQELLTGRIRLA